MYKCAFSDDFLHRARKSVPDIEVDEHILNAALVDIDKNQGKSLADFPRMPIPIRIKSPYEEALIIQRELDYNVDEQLAIVAQHVLC